MAEVDGQVVLEEEIDPDYEPTADEVRDYAEWLGMDPDEDKELLWIAREGLKAPLPDDWKPCKNSNTDEIYYYNFRTGESEWDHPCDQYYKAQYKKHKAQLAAKQSRNSDGQKREREEMREILSSQRIRKAPEPVRTTDSETAGKKSSTPTRSRANSKERGSRAPLGSISESSSPAARGSGSTPLAPLGSLGGGSLSRHGASGALPPLGGTSGSKAKPVLGQLPPVSAKGASTGRQIEQGRAKDKDRDKSRDRDRDKDSARGKDASQHKRSHKSGPVGKRRDRDRPGSDSDTDDSGGGSGQRGGDEADDGVQAVVARAQAMDRREQGPTRDESERKQAVLSQELQAKLEGMRREWAEREVEEESTARRRLEELRLDQRKKLADEEEEGRRRLHEAREDWEHKVDEAKEKGREKLDKELSLASERLEKAAEQSRDRMDKMRAEWDEREEKAREAAKRRADEQQHKEEEAKQAVERLGKEQREAEQKCRQASEEAKRFEKEAAASEQKLEEIRGVVKAAQVEAEQAKEEAERAREEARIERANAAAPAVEPAVSSKLLQQISDQAAKIDEQAKQIDEQTTKIDEQAKQIDEQTTKIDEQAKQIDEQTTKIDEQAKQIDEQTTKIDEQAKQIDAHTTKIDEQAKQIDEQTATIDKHCSIIDALQRAAGEQDTSVHELQSQQTSISAEHKAAVDEADRLRDEVAGLREELAQKVAQEAAVRELTARESTLQTKEREVQARESTLQTKEREVQARESTLQTKEREVQARESTLQTKEREVQARESTLQTKEREAQARESTLQTKEREVQARESTLQTKEREVQARESTLQTKEREVQARESTLQTKEREVQATPSLASSDETNELRAKLAATEARAASASARLSEANAAAAKAQQSQQRTIDRLQQDLGTASEARSRLKQQLEQASREVEDLQQRVDAASAQTDSATSSASQDKDQGQKELESEVRTLKLQLEDARTDADAANDQLNMLRRETRRLEDELEAAEQRADRAGQASSEDKSATEAALKEAKEEASQAAARAAAAESALQREQGRAGAAHDRLQKEEEHVGTLQLEIRRLERQLKEAAPSNVPQGVAPPERQAQATPVWSPRGKRAGTAEESKSPDAVEKLMERMSRTGAPWQWPSWRLDALVRCSREEHLVDRAGAWLQKEQRAYSRVREAFVAARDDWRHRRRVLQSAAPSMGPTASAGATSRAQAEGAELNVLTDRLNARLYRLRAIKSWTQSATETVYGLRAACHDQQWEGQSGSGEGTSQEHWGPSDGGKWAAAGATPQARTSGRAGDLRTVSPPSRPRGLHGTDERAGPSGSTSSEGSSSVVPSWAPWAAAWLYRLDEALSDLSSTAARSAAECQDKHGHPGFKHLGRLAGMVGPVSPSLEWCVPFLAEDDAEHEQLQPLDTGIERAVGSGAGNPGAEVDAVDGPATGLRDNGALGIGGSGASSAGAASQSEVLRQLLASGLVVLHPSLAGGGRSGATTQQAQAVRSDAGAPHPRPPTHDQGSGQHSPHLHWIHPQHTQHQHAPQRGQSHPYGHASVGYGFQPTAAHPPVVPHGIAAALAAATGGQHGHTAVPPPALPPRGRRQDDFDGGHPGSGSAPEVGKSPPRSTSPLELRPTTGAERAVSQGHGRGKGQVGVDLSKGSPSRDSARRVLASHGRWLARVRSKLELHEATRAKGRAGESAGSSARARKRERALLRRVGAELQGGEVVLNKRG